VRALYDDGLTDVYGYLLHRCGDLQTAEDLTSETFLAAVAALQSEQAVPLNVAWLIGVARHKLVDHWRRRERQERNLRAVEGSWPSVGLYGGHDEPRVEWYVSVDDIRALVPRVAELGGQAGAVTESPSGLTATCTDDQGMTVRLWQPAPGY